MGDATAPLSLRICLHVKGTELHLAVTLHSSGISEHAGVFSDDQADESLQVLGSQLRFSAGKTWFTTNSCRLMLQRKQAHLAIRHECTWHRS
jgi:hypothetical protein